MNAPQPAHHLPLLGGGLDATLAWREGRPIAARQFLADVKRQAERLPGKGSLLNRCTDRYRFAVGYAAALLQGRTNLLLPDLRAETRAQLPGTQDMSGPGAS